MSIGTILEQKLDNRHGGDDCFFNGYLEDYLNLEGDKIDSVLKDTLQNVLNANPDARVCVGLKSVINKDAISNQIIRYKDIFKLEGKPLIYPYIIYETKQDLSRAVLIVPHEDSSYLYAKGFYYCMTEPGGLFIDCKNEIVAVSSADRAEAATVFAEMFTKKAGAIQRSLDHRHFTDYTELKKQAVTGGAKLRETAYTVLKDLNDRSDAIYEYVVKWFLLKKVLYVQYMVNKDILNKVHDGNVKRQRNQAKVNADEVLFISYSEMWRTDGTPSEVSITQDKPERG